MKGILVVIDGVGDLPNKQLDDKTPLEASYTPNLDFLATRGEMGYMYPVRPSFVPESDDAILCLFGNDVDASPRGPLEVAGTDIKLKRGDLALRVQFATVGNNEVIDRRVGRTLTTVEAEILAKELNKKIKLPMKFEFKSTIQHRGVLVLRGGFSDNISSNDLFYRSKETHKSKEKLRICKPLDEDDNSQYTANIVNEFVTQAYDILNEHPVNEFRRKKGLMPANHILFRGAGIEIPKLKQYKKWLSINYMPLEIGFSRLSGMSVLSFEYPKLKKVDVYDNLQDGLRKATKFFIKSIKKNHKKFDYAYVQFKETDIPGHDNKPFEKKAMIEYLDKTVFKFLRRFAPPNEVKIVVTGDHSTPCKLKAHSADPVPVLFYNCAEIPKEKKFCEKTARRGVLGRIDGKELLKKVGFDK